MVKIVPSLLASDFSKLGMEVKKVVSCGADWIHFDVMDGHFVPNLTFGPDVVRCLRKKAEIPFDVHLMITNPKMFIRPFAEAGADLITIHIESDEPIEQVISVIKKYGCKVGLSIKPTTNVSRLIPYLPMIDLVLIMSVEPGFGGQEFQKEAIKKIAEVKNLIGKKKVLIEVDGGINEITAPACRLAGADVLVAGSAIFHKKNYQEAIERLKK